MANDEPRQEAAATGEPATGEPEAVGQDGPAQTDPTPAAEPDGPAQTDPTPAAEPDGPRSTLSLAISSLHREKDETWERLLRTAAEYDNYKKRSKRDLSDAAQRAENRVVLEFLPVIDNLERALAHAEEQEGPLLDGVRMVYKQFLTTLEKFDIRPFDSVGEPFDPERHEAIQQIASDEPAGVVCHELQRGYLRGARLVRPAMVVVSSGPAAAGAGEEQGEASSGAEEQ